MVNVVQSASLGASSAALHARASAATAALSTEPGEVTGSAGAAAAQPSDQKVISISQAYRYNSFEFSYRQDFGKIVLLRQKPDTGEVVQQFPSEYYLRKYADGQRVAENAVGDASGARQTPAATTQDVQGTVSAATSQAPASPDVAPAPAPSVPSAPALPSAGASATSAVDLTV